MKASCVPKLGFGAQKPSKWPKQQTRLHRQRPLPPHILTSAVDRKTAECQSLAPVVHDLHLVVAAIDLKSCGFSVQEDPLYKGTMMTSSSKSHGQAPQHPWPESNSYSDQPPATSSDLHSQGPHPGDQADGQSGGLPFDMQQLEEIGWDLAKETLHTIRKQPIQCLGIAFGVGVAAGLLLRGRSRRS